MPPECLLLNVDKPGVWNVFQLPISQNLQKWFVISCYKEVRIAKSIVFSILKSPLNCKSFSFYWSIA